MRVRSQLEIILFLASAIFTALLPASPAIAQNPLETPLDQELLTLLTNEVSGQIAFNNLGYSRYLETHPNVIADLGLSSNQTRWILNFVNGDRSISEIRNRVAAITGNNLRLDQVAAYLAVLEEVGWITY